MMILGCYVSILARRSAHGGGRGRLSALFSRRLPKLLGVSVGWPTDAEGTASVSVQFRAGRPSRYAEHRAAMWALAVGVRLGPQ